MSETRLPSAAGPIKSGAEGGVRIMDESKNGSERLRRERDAAEHETAIAKRLLGRAAAEIEDLADADCDEILVQVPQVDSKFAILPS